MACTHLISKLVNFTTLILLLQHYFISSFPLPENTVKQTLHRQKRMSEMKKVYIDINEGKNKNTVNKEDEDTDNFEKINPKSDDDFEMSTVSIGNSDIEKNENTDNLSENDAPSTSPDKPQLSIDTDQDETAQDSSEDKRATTKADPPTETDAEAGEDVSENMHNDVNNEANSSKDEFVGSSSDESSAGAIDASISSEKEDSVDSIKKKQSTEEDTESLGSNDKNENEDSDDNSSSDDLSKSGSNPKPPVAHSGKTVQNGGQDGENSDSEAVDKVYLDLRMNS